jgi:hypothetical protein
MGPAWQAAPVRCCAGRGARQSHGRGLCLVNGKASWRLVRFDFGRCWDLFGGGRRFPPKKYCYLYYRRRDSNILHSINISNICIIPSKKYCFSGKIEDAAACTNQAEARYTIAAQSRECQGGSNALLGWVGGGRCGNSTPFCHLKIRSACEVCGEKAHEGRCVVYWLLSIGYCLLAIVYWLLFNVAIVYCLLSIS